MYLLTVNISYTKTYKIMIFLSVRVHYTNQKMGNAKYLDLSLNRFQ